MTTDRATDAVELGHDATSANRARQDPTAVDSVWLFGYGSLIHKVDFPFLERRRASVRGWSRRFWQGSHDHRGTPEHPGRVVTLVPDAGATCVGIAYRVAPATFEQLDVREKNGYRRVATPLEFGDGAFVTGMAYVAEAGNPAWLGAASEAEIARHIAGSAGPSGSNAEYVLGLARALRELGADAPHVYAVEAQLRALCAIT